MSDGINPWYARFIRDSGCIRKSDHSVKPQAFFDKRPPHNTSVNKHSQFKLDIHWDVGQAIDPTRVLIGAADISKAQIGSVKMDVVDTDNPGDPKFHAEIRGWDMRDDDEGKHARREKARELADLAVFVDVPKDSCIAKVPKADLAVIILTKDEKLHIGRCLERIAALSPRQVFVVDCFSTDGTQEIVTDTSASLRLCVKTVEHEWPGLQSVQFNWALDNLPIEAKWVLRLDADEYLTPESIDWLKANLDGIDEKVSALEFTLERKFMGGMIRHGTNGIKMVRMFRRGRGRYAETLMDERIVYEGEKLSVPVVFYDDNLNTLEWWKEKHRGYAKREAQQAIESLKSGVWTDPRKASYYRWPPYIRAFAYFFLRYVVKRGFLDGRAGWRWHFWQGLWYRWIVDREIGKLRR